MEGTGQCVASPEAGASGEALVVIQGRKDWGWLPALVADLVRIDQIYNTIFNMVVTGLVKWILEGMSEKRGIKEDAYTFGLTG